MSMAIFAALVGTITTIAASVLTTFLIARGVEIYVTLYQWSRYGTARNANQIEGDERCDCWHNQI